MLIVHVANLAVPKGVLILYFTDLTITQEMLIVHVANLTVPNGILILEFADVTIPKET